MFDEDDPLAARHRREKWRRQWIKKFAERQRIARRWIEVVEIAKWCARSTTGTGIEDEQSALELAYQRLVNSAFQGEFERDGRSKMLYLDPRVRSIGVYPHRLTPERIEIERNTAAQFEMHFRVKTTEPASSLPMNLLPHCWLPCDMARRWLEAHGYRLPPYLQPTAAKPGAGSDEPAQPPSNAPVVDAVPVNGDDAAIDGTAMVQRLAKWIFCQRAQASNFKTLLAGARQDPQLGTFREADFLAAYRSVYATKSGRPPITGWPLQPEYKKRVGEKSPPN